MKKLSSVGGIALFFAATFFAAACGGSENQPAATAGSEPATQEAAPAAQEAPDDALIAQGKELFEGKAICFTCHGPDATGTPLAPNLTDDVWLNIEGDVTKEKFIALVKQGVAEPKEHPAPMLPGGGATLTDAELDAVATYVLSLGM